MMHLANYVDFTLQSTEENRSTFQRNWHNRVIPKRIQSYWFVRTVELRYEWKIMVYSVQPGVATSPM